MVTLEDEIATLSTLDTLRVEALEQLKSGIDGLCGSAYAAHGKWEAPRLERARIEHALLLQGVGIADRRGLTVTGEYRELLERTTRGFLVTIWERLLNENEPGHTPVLIAGRALQALTTPGLAWSKSSVTCLYRVLRELFSSEPPLWSMGSARAGEGCHATAFVTGECCRGILGLSRALARTAHLCRELRRVHARRGKLAASSRVPTQWRDTELRRMERALEIDVIWMRPRTIFRLDGIGTNDLDETASQLGAQLEAMCEDVAEARTELVGARSRETIGLGRSESPHRTALDVIDDLQARFTSVATALKAFDWEQAGARLADAAKSLNDHLEPSRNFIGAILDHELAAVAAQKADRDLPELAFAATTFGILQDDWDDPRLDRAAEVLVANVTGTGRLPTGRPFKVLPNGYRLHPVGAEVLLALASLLRHKQHAITTEVVASAIRLFRDTQCDVPGGIGWGDDAPIDPDKASWWVSAVSIIALDRIVRMLDSCLNERIGAHFSVTNVERLKVDLDETFYPDYGLARADRESVAIYLQRIRAHLLGIPSSEYRNKLGSIVLYGPPGTGKTTLAEALAKSAGKRLIQITPSDIVVGGADRAEHRARVVFQALAMLTDMVILFDEFDPLLRRRPSDGKVPTTIFELLTPGMLPKLEKLHDSAKDQRVGYLLATNFVGSLDDAAIRDGRFDEKVGIYPPDLTSRLGRLLFMTDSLTPDQEPRFLRVCAMTHDSPMSTLGRHGWYTHDDHPVDGSGQAFIADETKLPHWPTPEFSEIRRSGEGRHAELELAEWLWNRTPDWQIAGGPAPGGDLQAYLRSTTWSELRRQLAASALSWDDVTTALDTRPAWEPFFTWVTAELAHQVEPTLDLGQMWIDGETDHAAP
jgi:hypothetical protein